MKTSFRDSIHQNILKHFKEVKAWLAEKSKDKTTPFYSSFDIRDSDFKIACVDANLFPAGFNNICEEDQRRTSLLMQEYLKKNHTSVKHILLLSEEHTRNLYYWDNVSVIKSLIEQGGWKVSVCVPGKQIQSPQTITTASGKKLSIHLLNKTKGDLVISNNDFSSHYDLPADLEYSPPVSMGWLTRKKHHFFKEYNELAREFAELLKIDPWHLTIETELFSPFDLESEENLSSLKSRTENFLKSMKEKSPASVKEKPYLFLKNNSGTYGLGVININDPENLNQWSYKARKKMKAVKGEEKISEIIIQEGIPTAVHSPENQIAEPVVYMVGCEVAGGFLRSHGKKDHKTSLNSPGAVYRRFCMSDLEVNIQGLNMENVYSWLGHLGVLALSREIDKYQS